MNLRAPARPTAFEIVGFRKDDGTIDGGGLVGALHTVKCCTPEFVGRWGGGGSSELR